MTALDLAREYFPHLSDRQLDALLWERTGFPEFFDGEGTIEEQLRAQLKCLASEEPK